MKQTTHNLKYSPGEYVISSSHLPFLFISCFISLPFHLIPSLSHHSITFICLHQPFITTTAPDYRRDPFQGAVPHNNSDLCDLLSFPFSWVLGRARCQPVPAAPCISLPRPAIPRSGPQGPSQVCPGYKSGAAAAWFAAEGWSGSSSPPLNLFCLLLFWRSPLPSPVPKTWHTGYWGLPSV